MMQLNGRDITAPELSGLALYGYGHFTSMRVENVAVRGLALHIDRLRKDAHALFGVELDLDRVRDLLRRTAKGFGGPAVIRVTIFDPRLELGHPSEASDPQILISSRSAAVGALPPLRVTTTEYDRDCPDVKHVGLFETIRTRRIAQKQGYDDVLFVGSDANISEGATWNIGFHDGEQIVWPKADVLPGVTMRILEQALQRVGVPNSTIPLTIDSLGSMRIAFATNAAVGVRPIRAIGGHEFSLESPMLQRMRDVYDAIPWEPI